jgi:O-succinylbenzoic acid--CoA ligase
LSAKKTIHFFDLPKGIKALNCLSLETIAGKMMLVRSFVGNWELKILEPRSNPLKNSDESFDFVALVPLQLERILLDTPEKIKNIKTIIVGGAPVTNNLINLLKNHEISVYQTFGMTETVSHIALRKIGFQTEEFYQTVDGVEVSEKNGNLVIHYPEMFSKSLFTNDCVEIHSNKQFKWLGRSDFVINSGGVKLNPEKIEQKLAEYIPFPFFITSVNDERLGQKLGLIIERNLYFIPEKQKLKALLDKFEIPKVYLNVDEFERTISGKINRLKTIENLTKGDWKELI